MCIYMLNTYPFGAGSTQHIPLIGVCRSSRGRSKLHIRILDSARFFMATWIQVLTGVRLSFESGFNLFIGHRVTLGTWLKREWAGWGLSAKLVYPTLLLNWWDKDHVDMKAKSTVRMLVLARVDHGWKACDLGVGEYGLLLSEFSRNCTVNLSGQHLESLGLKTDSHKPLFHLVIISNKLVMLCWNECLRVNVSFDRTNVFVNFSQLTNWRSESTARRFFLRKSMICELDIKLAFERKRFRTIGGKSTRWILRQ